MKLTHLLVALVMVFGITLPESGSAAAAIDADIIYARLRPSLAVTDPCSGVANCFTYRGDNDTWYDGATAISTLWNQGGWIWSVRNPSLTSPLVVDIGPGRFRNAITCSSTGQPLKGHVTFRGAGQELTTIVNDGVSPPLNINPEGTLTVLGGCDRLNFADLTLLGVDRAAVYWLGGGSSNWWDTELFSTGFLAGVNSAWSDSCANGLPIPVHYFFSTQVKLSGGANGLVGTPSGFSALCSENFFFGGEIELELTQSTTSASKVAALTVMDDAIFEAFGTKISAEQDVANGAILYGVSALLGNGSVSLHGGSVNSVVNTGSNSARAITAGASVRSAGTAFHVKAGTGATPYRIFGGIPGTAGESNPYLWEGGPRPPESTTETNALLSENAQDLYVETDCSSAGNCSAGGFEVHLMVYDASCTATGAGRGPWRNQVTGRCRGDLASSVGSSVVDAPNLASGACSVSSFAAAGVLTTDVISWTPSANISGIVGYTPANNGSATITAYPTAGNVNFNICNPKNIAVNPGAITLNWRVQR